MVNNRVVISGMVDSELTFSHMAYGENFYIFKLRVPRLSDNFDVIDITISERSFVTGEPKIGDIVRICGSFRSFNKHSDMGNRLILSLFVRNIEYLDTLDNKSRGSSIFLDGFICKPVVYRVTPNMREIADILLAVNRTNNKSDYIPCIAWGRNAKYAETLPVGTNLKLWGRIQSREYQKKITDEEFETRTAFEVSINKFEVAEDDGD